MQNKQFKITNKIAQKITLSLEPEGNIVELSFNTSVILEFTSAINSVIDIDVNQSSSGLYLSIWPEKGSCYEIIEEI